MIHYREYKKPSSLSEAYELNQKKSAVIAGGFCFLRTGSRTIQTLIDLSGLLSDKIEEDEEVFRIGAMVTLRDLELHRGLDSYMDGAVKDSVRHIVGTQFRNLATIGGSIFGRYGFSDLLTLFLSLDTEVELYNRGRISLAEFASMEKDTDILLALLVKKTGLRAAYESMRNEATDFPVLAVSVADYDDGQVIVSVGARPARAEQRIFAGSVSELADKDGLQAKKLAAEFTYGTNMRGSSRYREHLAGVLIRRAAGRITDRREALPCR